jgi:hypothetical protein
MPKFRKAILALLLGCFAIWVFASAWIHHSYFVNLPKTPDEKNGRIYRMVVRGSDRYGSEGEVHTLSVIENARPIAFLFFLIAVTVGFVSGDFKIAPGRKLNE